MEQRERTNHEAPQAPQASGAGGVPGANLNAVRQAGAAMLAAADDAINRVLSGDSKAFNAAVRQEGGQ